LGHLAIGDRRGLLLLILQPLAILGVLVVAFQLIDGTRWLVVFPPLALLLVLWLGQAVHAYRRAIDLGAKPGGELQVALYLPVAVAVLTAFWLVGGKHGSPSATLEAYVVSWVSVRPDAAATLYAEPPEPAQLGAQWASEMAYLGDRVAQLAATYGPSSGLDPQRPFANLRFRDPVADLDGRELVVVDIVRSQQFQNMVLGIIPTASQQTVLVEQAGAIRLRLEEQPANTWLSIGQLDSYAWKIDSVEIGGQ
jgi:hypothetical protein